MKKMTIVQALNNALDIKMGEDKSVYCMGEDIGWMGGDFGVTRGLFDKYGAERMRDTPLSESAIIGTAVGSAMVGMRPVAEIMFADFISVAHDQLVNNAAKMNYMFDGQFKSPIVIRTACGGGFGGGPHHSQMVEGWFMNVPGLVMVAPTNPYDAKGLMIASIEDDNPILFLEHKALYSKKGEVPEEKYTIPLRKANVVKEGKDITIVADMWMVLKSQKVAEKLEGEGISVELIDLRTIRPWDHDTVLESVKKTGKVVVVNESPPTGGLSADVSAVISEKGFSDLKAPVKRVTALDTPIPFSVPLENIVLPSEDDIEKAVRAVLAQ
jgi:acetoin:2,6-dichlorophenolindophenol oxidoreductase subunit beta